jgi:hypothetical protein
MAQEASRKVTPDSINPPNSSDEKKFPLATMSLRTCINKSGDIWDIDIESGTWKIAREIFEILQKEMTLKKKL